MTTFKKEIQVGLKTNKWFFLLALIASVTLAQTVKLEVVRNVPSTYMYPTDGFLPFNIHRGTQTMLTLMVPGCSFNDPAGVACALLKSDHDPKQPQNDVVITCVGVNSGAGEIVYNVGLKELRRFGTQGSGEKQFLNPTGVAIDSEGDVAVADTGNDRICLLHHDGMRLTWVKAVGKKGTAPGEFSAPTGVAYDSQGHLYVTDSGNNRIQMMSRKGHCVVLQTPALEYPTGIAAIDAKEAWTFYPQGPYADRLAVIDQGGQRLRTLTLDGQPLYRITAPDMPDGPVSLWGCAFDYFGNVIATDTIKGCLRKFDKDLRYVTSFGTAGDDDFQFNEPRGIAFNHQFGQVLVAEKNSVQYFWNGTDALDLRQESAGGTLKFPFKLTERSLLTAEIRDSKGTVVKPLATTQDLEMGPQELDWTPDPATPKGSYTLFMKLMATYSTRDRVAKEIEMPVTLP
jgi:DNA-binding beta-propeller fold protein YncE